MTVPKHDRYDEAAPSHQEKDEKKDESAFFDHVLLFLSTLGCSTIQCGVPHVDKVAIR